MSVFNIVRLVVSHLDTGRLTLTAVLGAGAAGVVVDGVFVDGTGVDDVVPDEVG